jgi:hypothetical protein
MKTELAVAVALAMLIVAGSADGIARNATCPAAGLGIFALDASSIACRPLERCRLELCTCLGVGDGDRCWLRSFASCQRYASCFAVATNCIEAAAQDTSDARCDVLRAAYNQSAPLLPANALTDRLAVYAASTLSAQCRSVTCNAYRGYFPASPRCELDYSAVCDAPWDYHVDLVVQGSGANFVDVTESSIDAGTMTIAVRNDADALAVASGLRHVTTSVLALLPVDGGKLRIHLRLDNSTYNRNITSFLRTGASNSSWLVNANNVYASVRGVGTLVVTSFAVASVPLPSSDLNEILDSCDNDCVIGVTCGVIVIVVFMMLTASCCWHNICATESEETATRTMAATVRKVFRERRRREALLSEAKLATSHKEHDGAASQGKGGREPIDS